MINSIKLSILLYFIFNMLITLLLVILSVIMRILDLINNIELFQLFKKFTINYYYSGKLFSTDIIMWRFHIVAIIVIFLFTILTQYKDNGFDDMD